MPRLGFASLSSQKTQNSPSFFLGKGGPKLVRIPVIQPEEGNIPERGAPWLQDRPLLGLPLRQAHPDWPQIRLLSRQCPHGSTERHRASCLPSFSATEQHSHQWMPWRHTQNKNVIYSFNVRSSYMFNKGFPQTNGQSRPQCSSSIDREERIVCWGPTVPKTQSAEWIPSCRSSLLTSLSRVFPQACHAQQNCGISYRGCC